MTYSSILGADRAPIQPSGRGSDLLGPSDNSDSGSDALGTEEIHGDSDSSGTGERGVVTGVDGKEGADILPDRIVRMGPDDTPGEPGPDAGITSEDADYTDLDDAPDGVDSDEGP
ncbi:MAG: hypothetical protein RL522_1510 [Pseudomonadota bacterium]|jgi:hypothetical protein